MSDPAPKRPAAAWSKAPAQAVWQSNLPKCLKRGVAGKIAAYTREDGTLTRPMTVPFLVGEIYPGGRTLSKREVQRQLRALEDRRFLLFDPNAIVSRSRPREYTVNLGALVNESPTLPPFASRRSTTPRSKGDTKGDTNGDTKGDTKGDILPGLYTDPDPDPYVRTESTRSPEPIPSTGGTEDHSEQQRAKRAASPDVVKTGPGWHRFRDHAALDAELATLPIPGLFASPRQARKFGYRLIDARRSQLGTASIGGIPLATFDDWVAALQVTIEAAGIITSEAICRQAMADCIVERAQRDRSFDPDADRERRRGRK